MRQGKHKNSAQTLTHYQQNGSFLTIFLVSWIWTMVNQVSSLFCFLDFYSNSDLWGLIPLGSRNSRYLARTQHTFLTNSSVSGGINQCQQTQGQLHPPECQEDELSPFVYFRCEQTGCSKGSHLLVLRFCWSQSNSKGPNGPITLYNLIVQL